MYHLCDPRKQDQFDAARSSITLCGKRVHETSPMFHYLLWDKRREELIKKYDICKDCLKR